MKQTFSNTIPLLESLVGFDTTSDRSNVPIVEFIADYLRSFRVDTFVVFNEDGCKANLFATIGPAEKSGVILSGHTDVVPVAGQAWTHDPFSLRVSDGKAFGRGACDMKGFLACVLAAVPHLVTTSLKRPVHIALSHDEEIGCVGIRSLLPEIRKRTSADTLVIVGEPTGLQPVTAHKGKHVLKCRLTGTPMHSSQVNSGVSAIACAGNLLHRINNKARELRRIPSVDNRFVDSRPTINFGRITGGVAVNVVSEHCEFDVEYRYPPGKCADDFIAFMRQALESSHHNNNPQVSPDGAAEMHSVADYPSFENSAGARSVELVAELSGATETGAVEFGTEAGLFADMGFDTVVFGPGSIQQAHQPDEFIALSELQNCDRFLHRLGDHFSELEWTA